MSKQSRKKKNKRLREIKGNPYKSLLAAALAIPSISSSLPAQAQNKAQTFSSKLYYADYRDFDQYDDRMRIQAPIAWVRAPINDTYDIEGSFILDSMSGASPFYHNTLTGASGMGVEDTRRAADLKVTRFGESYSLSLGGAFSDEDDYESQAGILETSFWGGDKNTVFSFGFSGSNDDITSTLAPTLDESRNTFNFITGVTQVLDINSILQVNLSYTNGDGFFTDPYKTLDNRPRSREQWAILSQYNRYIESLGAAWHNDYRYYIDSWGVSAHMAEISWYQPIADSFILRPNIRYYSQDAADFFTDVFPPGDLEGFNTADQRMSSFGSFTLGMKLIADLGAGYSADLMYSYIEQRPEWKAFGSGSRVIEPFHARIIAFSLSKSF